jgi:hypothetical protein
LSADEEEGFLREDEDIVAFILKASNLRGEAVLEEQRFGRVNAGQEMKSMWAYLPVGPLERHFREGDQGGF